MPKKYKKRKGGRSKTTLTKPNPFYKDLVSTQSNAMKKSTSMPGTGPLSRMAQRKNR